LSSLLSQALLPQGSNVVGTTATPFQQPQLSAQIPSQTTTQIPTPIPTALPGQTTPPISSPNPSQPFGISFARPVLPQQPQPVPTPPVVTTTPIATPSAIATATPISTPTPTDTTQQQTKALLTSLFDQANQLTPEHKEIILQFLSGNRST
jgi:hypothetical protein